MFASTYSLKRKRVSPRYSPYDISTSGVEKIDTDSGRFYSTPAGTFPSVTTVLGSGWKPELIEWRMRVGDEEASKASSGGTTRGTALHNQMERYVLGEDIPDVNTKRKQQAFAAAASAIDDNVTEVNAVEKFLYSPTLGLAGTCDLVGYWKSSAAIMDFKTSSNIKEVSHIGDYFLQAAGYSYMVEEMTGHKHDLLVIIMANVDDPIPTIHVKIRTDEMIDRLVDARDLFLAGRNQ